MNRRKFLTGIAGVTASGVVLGKATITTQLSPLKRTLLHDSLHHDISGGFGLAPDKPVWVSRSGGFASFRHPNGKEYFRRIKNG